ncbi:hypothetical protein [Terriglobus tenax]|uniref:hypothetical protein n=1 Tax=Terriglobus tenax TaxID=1111115 RepID=UPI0021E0F3F3|nr:hypothetical protein [Terriglobus tenax]
MNRIASLLLASTMIPAAHAQQKAIAPPVSGLMVSYRFWPEQFVQWTGPEVPYSMVELDYDENNGKPLYDFIVTSRETGKRIHYANQPQLVAIAKAQDGEAYAAQIEFTRPDSEVNGATFDLRLRLQDGTPVEWRFIQGSDILQQGGGLNAMPELKIPVFAYREESAVAGEGSAIVVGDKTSMAEMWKEISKPPYFVAWHGALTHAATTAVLAAGSESFRVAEAPSELKPGAAWKLTQESGRTLVLKIEKAAAPHYTIGVESNPLVKQTIEAAYDGTNWAIEKIRYAPVHAEDHGMTLQFSPAFGQTETSTMDIVIGKKTKIASATLTGTPVKYQLSMKAPDWTKGKVLTGSNTISAEGVTLVVHP